MAALANAPDLEIARPGRAAGPIQIGHCMGRVLQVPSPAGPGAIPIHHSNAGAAKRSSRWRIKPPSTTTSGACKIARSKATTSGNDDRYPRTLIADKGNVERIA